MRTEYFWFVHHTTSILANLNNRCFEHSGDISCPLLVNTSHTDEPGKEETRVSACTLWIFSLSTLEDTDENRIFFVRSPQHKHFGKTQHLGDISICQRVNLSHTDESWEEANTCLWICTISLFIEHPGEHWWKQNIFCLLTTPQVFWQSLAPGAMRTLVTSVVFYCLTWATLTSPGKDETLAYVYTVRIYSLSTLENIDENKIFFVLLPPHKRFNKGQHLMLWAV